MAANSVSIGRSVIRTGLLRPLRSPLWAVTCTREAPWARHRSVDTGPFSRAHARFHEGPFNVQVVADGGADDDGLVAAWPDRHNSVGPGDACVCPGQHAALAINRTTRPTMRGTPRCGGRPVLRGGAVGTRGEADRQRCRARSARPLVDAFRACESRVLVIRGHRRRDQPEQRPVDARLAVHRVQRVGGPLRGLQQRRPEQDPLIQR